MSEKFELYEFRKLLKKGIGEHSQKDIADKCGISQAHLNRLLNQQFIGVPSKSTLERLSKGLDNISYVDLLLTCGYKDEAEEVLNSTNGISEYQQRLKMPWQVRVELFYKELFNAIKELCSVSAGVYHSIDDLMSIVTTLYMTEDTNWNIRKKECELKNNGRFAGWAVCIDVSAFIDGVTYSIPFVLRFYKTNNEDFLFESFSFKGKDLIANDALSESELYNFTSKGVQVECTEYLLLEYTKKENALLNLIFNKPTIDGFFEGYGFYLKEVPKHLNQFMLAHKNSFSDNKEEQYIIEQIENGTDAVEACSDYTNPSFDDLKGYGYAISIIMHRETKLPIEYLEDTDHDFEDNPPCVMIEDLCEVPKIRDMFYPYAKELGIPYIENIYFKAKILIDTLNKVEVV